MSKQMMISYRCFVIGSDLQRKVKRLRLIGCLKAPHDYDCWLCISCPQFQADSFLIGESLHVPEE